MALAKVRTLVHEDHLPQSQMSYLLQTPLVSGGHHHTAARVMPILLPCLFLLMLWHFPSFTLVLAPSLLRQSSGTYLQRACCRSLTCVTQIWVILIHFAYCHCMVIACNIFGVIHITHWNGCQRFPYHMEGFKAQAGH